MKRLVRNVWFWVLLLVAATNLVALGGVVYNRSGVKSEFKLSQRELTCDCYHFLSKDNSGLELRLKWRVFEVSTHGLPYMMWAMEGHGGSPLWLDAAKLESLGFAKSQLETQKTDLMNGRYHGRTNTRDVLLVLELDGPTYQLALERARERVAYSSGKDRDLAEKGVAAEESVSSRLFVVDAGLDEEAVRARYPDSQRYAIVHGQVSVQFDTSSSARGRIQNLSASEINVPLELRSVFGDMKPSSTPWMGPGSDAPFDATLAFGKRLEPWLVGATKK